jgi:glycosyltransferase involved in cell wall biosynthesis
MEEKKKYKILVLSDHALSTSGVGTQTRHLLTGLIKKGCWSFRQFGAALKHTDYRTVVLNDDFIIKPIDGFGNPDLIRITIATEKPDAIFLFKMEDEVRQNCPIVWWHVWDNYPFPEYNDTLYQATDLINCHSHMTYTMIKERYPEKTNFIPHALPVDLYFPVDKEVTYKNKIEILGEDRADHFTGIWVNRNAKRKRPSDVLESWKLFLEKLESEHGHRKATLIMHTDPLDSEGPNLFRVVENLKLEDNVFFSTQRLEFEKMNVLYNISDFCFTLSYAEGFGLSTLESMMTGTPIIAVKTGGLTRQVVDHRDGSENGVAIDVKIKTLVGSQSVPYIYEDYADVNDAAQAIYKMYSKDIFERDRLRQKVYNYATKEFALQKTVDMWHETMLKTIQDFKNKKRKKWEIFEI